MPPNEDNSIDVLLQLRQQWLADLKILLKSRDLASETDFDLKKPDAKAAVLSTKYGEIFDKNRRLIAIFKHLDSLTLEQVSKARILAYEVLTEARMWSVSKQRLVAEYDAKLSTGKKHLYKKATMKDLVARHRQVLQLETNLEQLYKELEQYEVDMGDLTARAKELYDFKWVMEKCGDPAGWTGVPDEFADAEDLSKWAKYVARWLPAFSKHLFNYKLPMDTRESTLDAYNEVARDFPPYADAAERLYALEKGDQPMLGARSALAIEDALKNGDELDTSSFDDLLTTLDDDDIPDGMLELQTSLRDAGNVVPSGPDDTDKGDRLASLLAGAIPVLVTGVKSLPVSLIESIYAVLAGTEDHAARKAAVATLLGDRWITGAFRTFAAGAVGDPGVKLDQPSADLFLSLLKDMATLTDLRGGLPAEVGRVYTEGTSRWGKAINKLLEVHGPDAIPWKNDRERLRLMGMGVFEDLSDPDRVDIVHQSGPSLHGRVDYTLDPDELADRGGLAAVVGRVGALDGALPRDVSVDLDDLGSDLLDGLDDLDFFADDPVSRILDEGDDEGDGGDDEVVVNNDDGGQGDHDEGQDPPLNIPPDVTPGGDDA